MKQVPNILSGVRIVLAPVFAVLYLQDELLWRSLSVAVFAVAAVTDFFDGYIARHYHAESSYGTFLDPLADKVLTFFGFICLPFIDASQFPWWAVALILVRDFMVTAMRMRADKLGKEMKTRYTAKVKTMLQMLFLYTTLLIGVFIQSDIAISAYSLEILESGFLEYALYLVVIITVYTGIEYIILNKSILIPHDR